VHCYPACFALFSLVCAASADNWYQDSFFLLHEDHHTQGRFEVGRDASLEETMRLLAVCKPDLIQIHAKGNPGWTTYPSKIGFTPPKLANDVMAIWHAAAQRGGYHFSAYYNIGRDGEIMTRHPAWNRVQADGQPVDRALCYHSGVAEEYLWPMVEEVLRTYRPEGFWFDGSCFTVQPCYCAACRRRFQREKQMELPHGPKDRGWADFQEVQRQIYREFVAQTAQRIHQTDPRCLVAVNWAYSLRMPEKPNAGVAYLTGDIGNRVEGLSPEAHWYDSQGLPFDLMTTVFTHEEGRPACEEPTQQTPPRCVPKPVPQLQQEMAVIIANGGRYFAWDNPSPTSGLSEERFAHMGRAVAPFLRERQPWCLGSRRLPDVSLLHSAAAHYAAASDNRASFAKQNNRIDGATAALARLHLNYEMIPDWRLASGDVRSQLLVVEHPKVVTAEMAQGVIDFVRRGGGVLWSGMGLQKQPKLQALFGLSLTTGPDGPEPLQATAGQEVQRFEHWLFRVTRTSAKTLLEVQTADGQPHALLTCNAFGKGRAFYVALPLLTRHGKQTVPEELVREIFAKALPPSERLLTTTAPERVEAVLRQQGEQLVIHLVNLDVGQRERTVVGGRPNVAIRSLAPAPPCRVSLRLAASPKSVRLEPQGKELTGGTYADGRATLDVPGFEVHQMIVVQP